jgi:hypothetical protein
MKKSKYTQAEHEEIYKALETLRAAGLQYCDDSSDVNKYDAIGLALAQVEDSIFAAGRLAHEYWQAHNAHDLAALLRWVFDHYLTRGGPVYLQEALWVKHLVDAESIDLFGIDGTARRYRVAVTIQEI